MKPFIIILMGIVDAITAGFKAVASIFGFAAQKDAQKNAAPVVAAKVAQNEQNEVAAETKATATEDLTKSRNELSEN